MIQHSNPVTDERITVTRDGDVAILTINNAERRNAMGRKMRQAYRDTIHQLMYQDSCRALVVTGAGEHFSAGADISEMTKRTIVESREILTELCWAVRDMTGGPKPVVAAVEGVAFGLGLSLAVASDFIVASRKARFCAAFIRIGLIPDTVVLWTLPKRVGATKAREMLGLAIEVPAEEGACFGLVDQLAEPGQALPVAVAKAKELATNPPLGMAFIKTALTFGADSMDAAIRSEIDYQPVMRQTQDHLEAARAFMEKRTPVFTGQ